MSVQIIVDSACDLNQTEVKELNVCFIPLKTYFGEEEFLDGISLTHEEFFEKLISSDVFPTTSQITPYEYEQYFQKVKDDGDTAVYLCLSSKLSGCYQSACLAASDYEGTVYVVDSENACIGQRLLVEYAVRLRDEGKSAEEIATLLNEKKGSIRLYALLDTLEYLKKGGRISAMTAFAGNLLNIKPIIAVEKGEVAVIGKARGNKAGNSKLTELIAATGGIDFSMPYCYAYSGLSMELLDKYMADYPEPYGGNRENVPIYTIGCAIGSHIGPGAIGVCYFEK